MRGDRKDRRQATAAAQDEDGKWSSEIRSLLMGGTAKNQQHVLATLFAGVRGKESFGSG